MEALLGRISLIGSDHLDESETTGLLGMGIKHDLALLDVAIFLEETGDLLLRKARVDAGDEEVGAWVDGTIIAGWTALVLGGRATTKC